MQPGGVATNVARALARLDVPVSLCGVTGNDAAGQIVASLLAKDGLTLNLLKLDGAATGQYAALHDPDGALAGACSDSRLFEDAPAAFFQEVCRALTPETLVFVDANVPSAILAAIACTVAGGRLIADGVSTAKVPRLRPILPQLDMVFVNHAEACVLAQAPQNASPDALSAVLTGLGAKAAVVTAGKEPLHARSGETALALRPPAAAISDVTGAGDALIAGTLAAHARGFDLKTSLMCGQRAAALTLEAPGAVAQTLSWSRIGPPA